MLSLARLRSLSRTTTSVNDNKGIHPFSVSRHRNCGLKLLGAGSVDIDVQQGPRPTNPHAKWIMSAPLAGDFLFYCFLRALNVSEMKPCSSVGGVKSMNLPAFLSNFPTPSCTGAHSGPTVDSKPGPLTPIPLTNPLPSLAEGSSSCPAHHTIRSLVLNSDFLIFPPYHFHMPPSAAPGASAYSCSFEFMFFNLHEVL